MTPPPDTADPDRVAVEAVIEGRVQGVWFRAWTRAEARALGLAGWVRNAADGSVRALFAGPRADVEEMLRRCHEGPPLARVDRVETRPASAPVEPGFAVRD